MPVFTYNRDIPNGPNNPSADQPLMKQNTNNTDDLLDVDHYSFNETFGGLHRKVQMPELLAIPGGLLASEGTLYTKNSAGTQLFYTPDNSGNEYQITRTIAASFTTFGKNIAYGTPPAGFTQEGGWTFLPGGMLLQYGFYGRAGLLGATGTIQFPVAFTNPAYSVTAILVRSSSANQFMSLPAVASSTNFTFQSSSSASDGVYWQAIGV